MLRISLLTNTWEACNKYFKKMHILRKRLYFESRNISGKKNYFTFFFVPQSLTHIGLNDDKELIGTSQAWAPLTLNLNVAAVARVLYRIEYLE